MSNIEKMINEQKDFKSFARAYAQYISKLLSELDLNALGRVAQELEDTRKNKTTLFIIGNGGSAATASHMVNDLGLGVRAHIEPSLKVMSLTDNVAVLTALANDVGYEQVFLRQLQLYFRPGDKLMVISASGNSPNLLVAAEWVRKQGGKVIGLLGFDGGKLKDICDIPMIVATPKGEYGPVEDVHMILDHLVYTWLWGNIRKEAGV
jgi:D-sedoheptulose 7-phosphate isomerase